MDLHLKETRIDGETVYDGHFLKVQRDRVALPDGKLTAREYIKHPGAVVILPLLDDGTVLMERQFRYPLDRVFIEFPAGKIDAGEDPLACAGASWKRKPATPRQSGNSSAPSTTPSPIRTNTWSCTWRVAWSPARPSSTTANSWKPSPPRLMTCCHGCATGKSPTSRPSSACSGSIKSARALGSNKGRVP